MLKQLIKKIKHGNFIPSGPIINCLDLDFRYTTDFEVYQCSKKTGNDIQSGPHYCGDIADFVHIMKDGNYVALCSYHYNPIKKEQYRLSLIK